ncbi:hypothetical protein LTR27_009871 [Elasticomyces elasticus]|nr:hypothetical protein LTR27_009871 [Elasticomyces elasticus]
MLAPKYVRFYAQDWAFLGALYPLRHTITQFTGIPAAILGHEKGIQECSIAQRLSWAAYRKTFKVEDMAYALLGILGVHLSLNYGEGAHAFVRLQEEILGRTGELSVLAWGRIDKTRRSALLASSPADFRHCAHVEVDPEGKVSEHWMTSAGLKGSFKVLPREAFGHDHWLSLHCQLGAETPPYLRAPLNHVSALDPSRPSPGAKIYLKVRPTVNQELDSSDVLTKAAKKGTSVTLSAWTYSGSSSKDEANERLMYLPFTKEQRGFDLQATIQR